MTFSDVFASSEKIGKVGRNIIRWTPYLKSPEKLKDLQCKKGQLSSRPLILYTPPKWI